MLEFFGKIYALVTFFARSLHQQDASQVPIVALSDIQLAIVALLVAAVCGSPAVCASRAA